MGVDAGEMCELLPQAVHGFHPRHCSVHGAWGQPKSRRHTTAQGLLANFTISLMNIPALK